MSNFELKPLGPVALTVKLAVGHPTPAARYLSVAKSLAAGLEPLAAAQPSCNIPLAFVAAQVTETALKAFLLKFISQKALATSADRHRIDALWTKATAQGLQLAPLPTPAIQLLVKLHQKPYPLRYSDEEGVRLLALPDAKQLVNEVAHVLAVVSVSIP